MLKLCWEEKKKKEKKCLAGIGRIRGASIWERGEKV